jgi:hypothetical protein
MRGVCLWDKQDAQYQHDASEDGRKGIHPLPACVLTEKAAADGAQRGA